MYQCQEHKTDRINSKIWDKDVIWLNIISAFLSFQPTLIQAAHIWYFMWSQGENLCEPMLSSSRLGTWPVSPWGWRKITQQTHLPISRFQSAGFVQAPSFQLEVIEEGKVKYLRYSQLEVKIMLNPL